MTVSRAKRATDTHAWAKHAWAVGACAAALALCAPAWGQNAPVDLSPPTRGASQPAQPARPAPAPTTPSPRPTPGADAPAQPGSPSGADQPVMGGAVESQTLGQVDPDVAGALREDQGGFGTAMWWGTERRVIENFMTRLPVTTSSPAMRALMRRLLLTGAEVPEGGKPGTLLSLRAGLLLAMGDFQGVNALLDVVPGYDDNPDLLRVEMDTRLLTGDVARACDMAHAHIDTQSSIYWQKAFNFCQAVEGQREAALLGLSLLAELGVDDPVFAKLVRAIAEGGVQGGDNAPVIDSLSDPTPLHLAMSRVAKAKLPSDVISSNRPGVLRAIAISPNADGELRLEAAERAEAAGALPTDALRQLYASISFSDEELKNPLTMARQRTGPMSRALLYRATLEQTVPTAQAEALSRALELARAGGRFASTARAFLPQLTRLEPSDDMVWFAPEAVRAFTITGRAQGAQPWFQILERAAQRDPEMARAMERLMPIARLADFTAADDWSMNRFDAWWEAVRNTDDARFKAATLITVMKAMGEYVPDSAWAKLTDGPAHQSLRAPHPSAWFLLESAARQARMGETVMLSMVALGEGGPARAEPIILYRVLSSLTFVSLEREARAMALEAAVAAGL